MVGGTGQNRPTVTLRAAGNKLTGTVGQVKVAGERPPTWGACDANGSHALGKPVSLFDGKSLDAWGFQMKDKPALRRSNGTPSSKFSVTERLGTNIGI